MSITHAVIPVAGLGTRFLPATKASPKEMLPIVDKPAIQYVVEEAAAAGMTDVLMITGRNKRSLEDHFDSVDGLELQLERKGDLAKLAIVRESSNLADIHYVRQGNPLGLGHAVLKAESHVGNNSFAVLLGDDLIDSRDALLTEMSRVQMETGGCVIALMEVPAESIHHYGCAAIIPTSEVGRVAVTGLIEKPSADEAPSNLAIIGRYILAPDIFDFLKVTPPGRGGEIQLTDALHAYASDPTTNGVHGVIFGGRRYDTGDKLEYLKSVITIALDRDDLGEDLRTWIEGTCIPSLATA